jgi:TonB-linked SusC/RagA family outer membrane protein
MKSKGIIFGLGCFIFYGLALTAYGQNKQKTVSGTVTDASTHRTLPGVNILLVGTTTGTATDLKGKYDITVPSRQDTLRFSFIGYVTQKVPINGRSHINIALQSKVITGKNLVVVGFEKQKRITLTGAISQITNPTKTLEKIPTPSLVNMLAGRLPGIITQQTSGEPGFDQASLLVRGKHTFVGESNAPLVLVDGVPRKMNEINPQEIQSFTVLKDASATAIYGSRGANGVILIRTKRGHTGKPQVTFRTTTGRLTALRLPDYIGGVKYAELENEANEHVGLGPVFTQKQIKLIGNQTEKFKWPNVDWVNTILKKHTFQNIDNLTISGGSDKLQYFANVEFLRKGGLFKHDNLKQYRANELLKRYNLRLNVTAHLSKNFKMYIGLAGQIQRGHYPGVGSPTIFEGLKKTTPIEYTKVNPDGSVAGGPSFKDLNPWGLVTQSGFSQHQRNRLQSTLKATWDLSSLITKGLSVSGKFAYDHHLYSGINHTITYELKQFLGFGPNDKAQYHVVREGQPIGFAPFTVTDIRFFYLQGKLHYHRTFFKNHDFDALLVFRQHKHESIQAPNRIAALPFRNRGLSGRLTYSYKNTYIGAFDFGYTGSENFAPGHRYGFFPSASVGWVVSNQKFWNVPFISLLKIRGSWGAVGNDQIGGRRFLYLGTAINNPPFSNYFFGIDQQNFPGFTEGQIGNPSVTWETSYKEDIGLHIKFLQDLVSLEVDVFHELRKNILLPESAIPSVTGVAGSTPFANIGRVKNRGLDAVLKINHTTPGGLFYRFKSTFTFAHNVRLKTNQAPQLFSYQNAVGHALRAPLGLKAIGFFKNEQDIKESPEQEFGPVHPGDIKYEDVNGDGVVNGFDSIFLNGYPDTPEITYGFGGTIALKGVSFSIFFSGASRVDYFMQGPSIYPFQRGPGTYNILTYYYNNRWTKETKNTAKFPAVTPNNNTNNFRPSSTYLENGSYLRLKTAQIAYTLPVKITQELHIQSAKFFLNGTNLAVWSPVKYTNPEDVADNGTGFYPLQRGVNVGLQIKF